MLLKFCNGSMVAHQLYFAIHSQRWPHIHKVSNYFPIGEPPLDQQYVYHSGRKWTTDGPPVAKLTIILCNKIQNNYFWKVIHLKQINLSQDSLFSRSVKTNDVQKSLRCSHQRTTIGPPTKYSSYRS